MSFEIRAATRLLQTTCSFAAGVAAATLAGNPSIATWLGGVLWRGFLAFLTFGGVLLIVRYFPQILSTIRNPWPKSWLTTHGNVAQAVGWLITGGSVIAYLLRLEMIVPTWTCAAEGTAPSYVHDIWVLIVTAYGMYLGSLPLAGRRTDNTK